METKKLKKAILWGIGLWLFGYVLGIIFFAFVPNYLLGWVIMPFGLVATLWVLFKKVNSLNIREYLWIGIIWALIAIVFDYIFLVLVFKPADGYYKLDVYMYYLVTLALPIVFGLFKNNKTNP